MEFIEGAILVIGGIWLVGRMSRQSATHPANAAAASPVSIEPNLTTRTNLAGGTAGLVTGEPLTTATPAPVLVSGAPPPAVTTNVSRPAPISNRVRVITGLPGQTPLPQPVSSSPQKPVSGTGGGGVGRGGTTSRSARFIQL